MIYKIEVMVLRFEQKVALPWSPDCPVPGIAIFFQRGAKTWFGCRGGTATPCPVTTYTMDSLK
jgi:hypothetical protein